MPFPPQAFYTLNEVANEWNVPTSTITKAILTSDLVCHFWLDKVVAYHYIEEDEGNVAKIKKQLCSMNGYIPMYTEDYRILLKHNQVALRKFRGDIHNEYFWLPERAIDVLVEIEDIVILSEEKNRFEELYNINNKKENLISSLNKKTSSNSFEFSADFREIKIENELFLLGEIQANIIKQLYEASKTEFPWCIGKKLLSVANSSSYKMVDVFKTQQNWRKLIISDGRGRYRLAI